VRAAVEPRAPMIRGDFPALRLKAFKGMRNLVAHHYQRVDYEIIWETIAADVPQLDAQATEILRRG
jgi:uncharacterized protein with HEPN domain